jgi:hypothetical protein
MTVQILRRAVGVAMPLLAAYVVVTSIAATVAGYSPVPFGDMWNGTLGFLLRLQGGDYTIWWAQHNEHRIVLARLIFYVDQALLGGLSILPFTVNVASAATATGVLCASAVRLARENQSSALETVAVCGFAAALAFSWIQSANFIWAFQASFFLAYVLPLSAFVLLAWSAEKQHTVGFATAALLGILSAGTLANGVLVLPIMVVLSLWCKTSTAQRLTLGLLAVLVPVLYFASYQSHAGHDSISATLARDPIGLLRYTFIYLGSPVHHLVFQEPGNLVLAGASGLLMVLAFAWSARVLFKRQPPNPTAAALLAFIGYVIVSALATAGGRLSFGLEQALAGRYTTPTLLAWACLAIVLWADRPHPPPTRQTALMSLMLVTAVALALRQNSATQFAGEARSARTSAALALALGIQDNERIRRVFPDARYALSVTRSAIRAQLSLFGHEPLRSAARRMSRKQAARQLPLCEARITAVEPIPTDSRYVRVTGWVAVGEHLPLDGVRLTSNDNMQIGLALASGALSEDLRDQNGFDRVLFQGYVLTSAAANTMVVVAEPGLCAATADAAALPSRGQ